MGGHDAGAAATATARMLVDGEPAGLVPADDRGLLYGDGVFRTVRADAGRRWLWDEHLRVLVRDAARIDLLLDDDLCRRIDADAATLIGADSGVLRITVTRGSGPRGYAPPVPAQPRVVLAFTPVPPPPLEGAGVRLRVARTRAALSPALAGIKHLGRLEQVRAAAECDDAAIFDLLMLDPADALLCTTRCNLFVRRGRTLRTPRVDGGGVAGVVREQILGGRIDELSALVDAPGADRMGLEALREADEVFLTNAVIGVRAVAELQDALGRPLASWPAPGPVVRCLQAVWAPRLGARAS